MLRKTLDRMASALMSIGLPFFFVVMFILAEVPIAPVGNILGSGAIALNVFAVVAVVVSLHVTLNRKSAASYFILGKRLGLDVDTHEDAREFFDNPLVAWFWLVLDFALLWLVVVMAVGSVLYNLAVVSRVYNPFEGDITLMSMFLFVLDQAFHGMFFDIMEVFKIALPSGLEFSARSHPIFACALVVFRMAITISFVQLFALYLGIYSGAMDGRLLRLAEMAVARKPTSPPTTPR